MHILPLLMSLVLSSGLEAAFRVTIDPGHGGEEYGAHYAGLRESDINLQISKKLHERLEKDPFFQSQLTRNQDKDMDLNERVEISKNFSSDLFVSLHANAHSKAQVSGTEFYIESPMPLEQEQGFLAHMESQIQEKQSKGPRGDVESILFDLKKSDRILRSYQLGSYLRKHWGPTKQKVIRQGGFYVLNHNPAPALLIEVGYLTNASERERLRQDSFQEKIAEKIHRSLKDYAKNMDKLPPVPLHTGHAKTR